MKREIKFRGWKSPYMINGLSLSTIAKEEDMMLASPIDEYIFMQFTGLKDKNGIEIYECDIVMSFKKAYEDMPSINTVDFVNGCFKLCAKRISDIPLFNYQSKDIEIIGNIYETPELFKTPDNGK